MNSFKPVLEAQAESELDYFGQVVNALQANIQKKLEARAGDFCPCCGDIIAEGHECEE